MNTITDLPGLLELATSRAIAEEDLDDLVHDAMASQAADINNSGLHAQLAFLLRTHGAQAAAALVADLGQPPQATG